jgi:hypothetical protein
MRSRIDNQRPNATGGSAVDVRCLRLVTRLVKSSGNATPTDNVSANHLRRGCAAVAVTRAG